jgi:cytochrome c553
MTKRTNPLNILLTTTLFALVPLSMNACDGGGKDGGAAAGGGADGKAEADKVWKERCTTCHGNSGKGDGPGAAALNPKPRSFTDPGWQGATDDARIKKVIVEGGAGVGLSEAMAPNPDLKDKAAVLDALVLKIRMMQG